MKSEKPDADRTSLATRSQATQDHAATRTLVLADSAAGRIDRLDALARLRTPGAIEHQLDPVHENTRASRRSEIEPGHAGCSQWFG